MRVQYFVYIPTIVLIFVLGLIVFLNNKKGKVNIAFGLFSLSIILWLIFQFIADTATSNSIALTFIRLAVAASLYIGSFFVLVAESLTRPNKFNLRVWVIAILAAVIFTALAFLPDTVTSASLQPWGAEIQPGNLYYVFIGYWITGFALATYLVIRRYKHIDELQKKQVFFLYTGVTLTFLATLVTSFAFQFSPRLQSYAVLFGVPSVIFIVAFSSYAILRHKLFDIRSVVARSFTYVLTIGIIAILYGFIAFRFANIFIGDLSAQVQQVFYVILTVIFAFTFAPLRRFFERISNRIFYRDRYDSQQLVNEVGRILASEIELDKVSHKVLHEITKQIKIDKGEIVVFGENQLFYENNVFKNGGGQISPEELSKLGRIMVVRDDIQTSDKKELMQKYGISISLALRTSEKFIGYMLLGEKKSGDIYNDQDLAVLKIIANEVSVAMANALSYKEIQLFSETLAEKVRQRTGQLRHANDQLKELDKAKDEFISMASHQLRTPLTTVKGYASMLEEGDFGKLTKEQSKIVEQTLDGSNRMARLIDDLLNVSRMDANRFFLEGNQVDLNKLVPEELEQLKSFAEGKNVKLTYEPPKQKIPIILLDENKTRQVVMNLVDNALHYSAPPAGGGHVKVSLVLNGDFVEFWVADDGIGVPEAVQKKLFTKMFRAPNAQGVRPDGTGLGLYLVKRVVEQQGGEIWFESKEGKGSTFGFKLPLSGIPKQVLEESKKIGAKVAASHAKSGN